MSTSIIILILQVSTYPCLILNYLLYSLFSPSQCRVQSMNPYYASISKAPLSRGKLERRKEKEKKRSIPLQKTSLSEVTPITKAFLTLYRLLVSAIGIGYWYRLYPLGRLRNSIWIEGGKNLWFIDLHILSQRKLTSNPG